MNTSRPFSADSNKLAYAQAFTRGASGHQHAHVERHASLRGLAARLQRTAKISR